MQTNPHTHMHINTHIYPSTHMCTYAHVHAYAHTYTYTCKHSYTDTQAHTHIYMCTHIHIFIHSHIHPDTHVCIHTQTHTDTHTYTHLAVLHWMGKILGCRLFSPTTNRTLCLRVPSVSQSSTSCFLSSQKDIVPHFPLTLLRLLLVLWCSNRWLWQPGCVSSLVCCLSLCLSVSLPACRLL